MGQPSGLTFRLANPSNTFAASYVADHILTSDVRHRAVARLESRVSHLPFNPICINLVGYTYYCADTARVLVDPVDP